jgi:uncharacterized protein with PIN domain
MEKFYVIHAMPFHLDEFVVIGILSKEQEANTFKSEAESSGRFACVASPQHLEMSVILELLIRDRLMQLHDPIMKIAEIAKDLKIAI